MARAPSVSKCHPERDELRSRMLDPSQRQLNENGHEGSRERHIDPLTGLRDRYDLIRHLDSLTASGQTCYLLMLKLDVVRFRDVNSRFGIALGDALLQQIARRLASLQADVAARVDADKFVIARCSDRREAVDGWLNKIGGSLGQKYFLAGIETKVEFSAGFLVVNLNSGQGSMEAGLFSL